MAHETRNKVVRIGAALIVGLVGAALATGGAILLTDGGSLYYLLAGLGLLGCAILTWRRDARAGLVYAVVLGATLVWSLWEAGFDFWQLVPRLLAPLVLGFLFLLPGLRVRRVAMPLAGVGVATIAVLLGAFALGHPTDRADDPAQRRGWAAGYPAGGPIGPAIARTDWPAFGGDQGGTRFSSLEQINAGNVDRLKVAWEADTGPVDKGPKNGLETVPIMIGDTLYACSAYNRVIAYDAETGAVRWNRDISGGAVSSGKPCRGVTYYRVPGATGLCAERIFAPSQMPSLVALDARTGAFCQGWGKAGRVDLRENIRSYPYGQYYLSSAPQLVRGKIVVGGGIPDGQYWGGPSGVVRAYDAVTGQLAWAYDSGRPDRIGAPAPGEFYTPSSPNNWAPLSADETLGLVYLPIGNATPDNYGARRRPGDERVASAVIALDAGTGRLRWSFQTTHHDIWDYDVPSQPTLVDLPFGGAVRPALIQPTKRGEIYVLDRRTGRPILPVIEQPVPQGGTAPGERLSPTQPTSVGLPGFRSATLRERDMWGVTPIDQMICRIQFRRSRYEGHLTPLSLDKPVIVDPGSAGGVNWGSVSVDLDRGVMIVNWLRLADRITLVSRDEAVKRQFKLMDGKGPGGEAERPMLNTPYGAYGTAFTSVLGTPCNAPPWGLISAVDLRTGRLIWSKPLGTARDTGPLGVPSMLPLTVGTPMTGGSITTRGGLVFIAATAERTIRALDLKTGRELWSARLPGGGNSTPMTYVSPKSGRQFVVIAAGGKAALQTRIGTKLVAYALPSTSNVKHSGEPQ